MNCLVTGATGLIGFELCQSLLTAGHRVIAVSRKKVPDRLTLFQANAAFKIATGDILDRQFTNAIFGENQVDIVFHLAVERHHTSSKQVKDQVLIRATAAFQTNFLGTINLLEAAALADIHGWIQSSTMNVYDFENLSAVPVDEACPEQPTEVNGLSMLFAEKIGLYTSRMAGFPILILRYPGVYGFGKNRGIVAKIVNNALSSNPLSMKLVSNRSSDFVYAKDIADANVLAMGHLFYLNGRAINVGSGQETYLPALAKIVMNLTGNTFELVEESSANTRRFYMNINQAKEELGFVPRTLEQGLREYIEDLKQQSVLSQNENSIQ